MNLAKRILTAFRVTLQKLAPHVKAAIIATSKNLTLLCQKFYKYGKERAPHVKAACISFSKRVTPFCQKLYKYSKGLPSHIKAALVVAIAIVAGSFISNCGETRTPRLIEASQGAESSAEFLALLGEKTCYGLGGSCSRQATCIVIMTQDSRSFTTTSAYRYCSACSRGHLKQDGTSNNSFGIHTTSSKVIPSKVTAKYLEWLRNILR